MKNEKLNADNDSVSCCNNILEKRKAIISKKLIAFLGLGALVIGVMTFTLCNIEAEKEALTKSYFTTNDQKIDWEPQRMLVKGKVDMGTPPEIKFEKDKILLNSKVFDIIEIQELEKLQEAENRFLIKTSDGKEFSVITSNQGFIGVTMGSITMLYKEKTQ